MLSFAMNLYAQKTSAEKFYNQGVILMKTQTIEAQKKAIAAFRNAKIAYDSQQKKRLCDKQITICNNRIGRLTAKQKQQKRKVATKIIKEEPLQEKTEPLPVLDTIPKKQKLVRDVSISFIPNMLILSKKGGKFVEVTVSCNQDKWKVIERPSWLTYTISKDKIVVKTQENKEKVERGGLIKIDCYGKIFELIVVQAK